MTKLARSNDSLIIPRRSTDCLTREQDRLPDVFVLYLSLCDLCLNVYSSRPGPQGYCFFFHSNRVSVYFSLVYITSYVPLIPPLIMEWFFWAYWLHSPRFILLSAVKFTDRLHCQTSTQMSRAFNCISLLNRNDVSGLFIGTSLLHTAGHLSLALIIILLSEFMTMISSWQCLAARYTVCCC